MDQTTLLLRLTDRFGKPEVARLIGKCTSMSTSMIYRTLSGERKLTFDEGEQLISFLQHHNLLPPDLATGHRWKYSLNIAKDDLPSQFINDLENSMMQLDVKNAKLWLTSYEIPVFYYMQFPELMAFKLFFWSKTIWSPIYKASEVFITDLWLTAERLSSIQSIYNQYCSIKSVEYLNTNMCINTARQLNYARDMGWFKNIKKYLDLNSLVYELLESLKEKGEKHVKKSPFDSTIKNKVIIKENEVYFTNNIYLIESNSQKRIFAVLDNPNHLSTSDESMVNRIDQWFSDLDTHSIAISHGSDLDKKRFFEQLELNFENLTG